MGQDEAVSLIEAARGIDLQNRKPEPDPGRFCILDQSTQQISANASSLVSRQYVKLVEKPKSRITINSHYADVASGELNDFIKCNIEIRAAVPTSPSLFGIDSHAGFSHAQRKRGVVTGGVPKGDVVHELLWHGARRQTTPG